MGEVVKVVHRLVKGAEREALLRIARNGGRRHLLMGGLRLAVHLAAAQVLAVGRQVAEPNGAQAISLCLDDGRNGLIKLEAVGTGSGERGMAESLDLGKAEGGHGLLQSG